MALKLDMSKAYDRMVSLIMSCLNSISYCVLLNGQPIRNTKLSRGLRRGDPLSPYLFLMCAMGLQSLIHRAKVEGLIQGVSICRNGPRISHLFFADNSVLCCRAKEDACQKTLDILVVYKRGSGQKINWDKTNIFFNSNTLHDTQVRIQQLLGVPTIRQYEK